MAEWTKGLGLLVHNEVWCMEVVGSIPASMAEWTKGLGLLVHNEVWCVGGCGFDPQRGNILGEFFILQSYLVRFSL